MPTSVPRIYRFLGFALDLEAGELRGGDRTVTLSRQQLALLRALALAEGRTVSREVLQREVWSGTIVSEGALRQAIWELRKLIGGDGERAIEAVRGRGYRLSAAIAVVPEVGPERSLSRAGAPRLVGRDREIEALERVRHDALQRAGRACVLMGGAGAGKSRLAREIIERAAIDGVPSSESYAEREGALPPLWPFTQLLESCLADADDALRARCKAAAPVVFAWLDFDGCSERAPALHEPSERRLRLFEQLSRALVSLLREQPRVCLLEDLQWCDEASLAFLAHHARALGQTRALWLLTCRTSHDGPSAALVRALHAIEQGPHNRQLVLSALGRSEVAALLASELGEAGAPEPLAAQIHALTGGNPLFVLELARALSEGAIPRDADQPLLDVPALQPVLERRLRRAPEGALDVLQAAAVLARDFSIVELAAVLQRAESDLAQRVDACWRSGLLIELGDHRFAFAHPLLQQTAYGLLGYSERSRLHERAARWLESFADVDRPRRLSELAHHYYQTGEGAYLRKALEYACKAGDAALAATAYASAAEHFQRALRCAEQLVECQPQERIALELARVEAMHADRGMSDAIRAEYLALAERARDAGAFELFARATLGYTGHQHTRFVPARFAASVEPRELAMLEEALAHLPADARELRVLTLCSLAYALGGTGEVLRRRRVLAEALDRAHALGDAALVARVLSFKVFAAAGPGREAEQLAACGAWVEIALAHGLPELELEARIARYLCSICCVDRGAAQRDAERAAQLAELIGTPHARSRARLPALVDAFGTGRLDEAERLTEQLRAAAPDDPNQQVIHIVRMATLSMLRGQAELAHAAAGYEFLLAANPHAVNLRAMLASVYAMLGRPEDARRELDAVAADDFAALPDDINWLPTMALLAEAVVCLGDAQRARALYDRLLPHADTFFFFGVETTPGASVALWLGDLAILLADFERAQAWLERAHAIHTALGFTLLDAYLAFARARLLIARRAPDAGRAVRRLMKQVRAYATDNGIGWLLARAADMEARLAASSAEAFELTKRFTPAPTRSRDN